MALIEAGIAVADLPVGDVAALATLAEAISNYVASCAGPIQTPVAKALWAIQTWYTQLGDEVRAETLLADLTQQESADLLPR